MDYYDEVDAAYWGDVDVDYRVARLAALEGAPARGEDEAFGDDYCAAIEAERAALRGGC